MINYRPNLASIWVSSSGSDSGTGTKASPFKTIQKAINNADPGTSIYVKAGTYNENVLVSAKNNVELKYTTAEKSIALISADGAGAATIRGRDGVGKSAIELLGMHDFVVDGFTIIGNPGRAHDQGPIKITGGATIYNDSGNVHIINNTVAGTGFDAIKAINTEEIVVAGNRFKGAFSEQVTDFVAVMDTIIRNNHVGGTSDSGITFKGGSTGALVTGNHIAFRSVDGFGPGVKIGGEGFNRTLAETPAELRGFEAKNITVTKNVIQDSGGFGVTLQGAHNSVISDNYVDNAGDHAFRAALSRSSYGTSTNKNNKVVDNILDAGLELFDIDAGATIGAVVLGNGTGTFGDVDFAYGAIRVGSGGAVSGPPAGGEDPDGGGTGGGGTGGGTRLEVRAGGTGTDAAAPKFTVLVDGVAVGTRTVADPVKTFAAGNDALYDSFVFDLAAAPKSKVEIRYLNDGTTGGVNRDLFIDHITLGGQRQEAETRGHFVASNGNAAFEGPTERLYVNGTLIFDEI